MRKLETVVDLIEALQEARGWTSDNQIAAGLKVPQTTVSSWRRGARAPSEKHALLIAEVLEISPALVLAISAVARSADRKERSAWQQVIEQIAQLGLPMIVGISFLPAVCERSAQAADPDMYIRSNRRRRSAEALQPTP